MVDYSLLKDIKQYDGGDKAYSHITEVLIPTCIKHIQDTYRPYSRGSLVLTDKRCGSVNNIGGYYDKRMEADIVLFIYTVMEKSGAVAFSRACQYDPGTGRPIAGEIGLNLFHMNDFRSSNFENNFMTIVHEIHHVLGFTSFFFGRYAISGTSKPKPIDQVFTMEGDAPFPYKIVLKEVKEFAMKHYACNNLEGVPLENAGSQGTAASHWDKFVAANDMMGPTDYSNPVFSELTMRLMEGTGWYKVNYDMKEAFFWGKNAGCRIFSGKCSSSPMTCSELMEDMCSIDYLAGGYCGGDKYTENCPVFKEEGKGDCRFT